MVAPRTSFVLSFEMEVSEHALITNPEAGLTILNKMRLHPETRRIPVIIASTITQLLRDNEDHLRAKGCDLLTKPFNLEELLIIIEKYLPTDDRGADYCSMAACRC